MARYAVSLALSHSALCRVTREIVRADEYRAILFAQGWLHQSRLSTRIIGMGYDSYFVEEVNKDGETRHVASGLSEDKECYRIGYKSSDRKAKAKKPSRGETSRFGVRSGKGTPPDVRQDYLPIRRIGQRKTTRAPRELSPFQQQMKAMVETAKLRAGKNGDVSPLGSNTHD